MGYDPKDDRKYCRFTDASGVCFKGARCKFRHLLAIKEGWSRDQFKVTIDIPLKLALPKVGSIIWLEPIAILSVNKFYAHLRADNLTKTELLHANTALNQLVHVMNEPEEIARYKSYQYIPGINELVICPFEGVYYRGKILDVEEGACVVRWHS